MARNAYSAVWEMIVGGAPGNSAARYTIYLAMLPLAVATMPRDALSGLLNEFVNNVAFHQPLRPPCLIDQWFRRGIDAQVMV